MQRVNNNTTIDESGNVIDDGTIIILHTYLYDAFGNELTKDADNTNPFRACCHYTNPTKYAIIPL